MYIVLFPPSWERGRLGPQKKKTCDHSTFQCALGSQRGIDFKTLPFPGENREGKRGKPTSKPGKIIHQTGPAIAKSMD